MLRLLGTKKFNEEMISEGSWGQKDLGPADSEMRLYHDNGRKFIEWEINFPDGDQDVEHIGFIFDADGDLIDYDGIMGWLPTQAADLIEEHGFHVNRKEYCDAG